MKRKLRILTIFLSLILVLGLMPYPMLPDCPVFTEAHSGRTDANGGHRDNKNVSGLGYYHYHCGGHPAHLHPNGVCPYSSPSPTITKPQKKAKLNRKKASVSVGRKVKLRLSNASGRVKWSSSNKQVAAVSQKGAVTAKRAGSCVITAKSGGKSYRCRVTVKNPFRLRNTVITLKVGETRNIKTNVKASSVSWTSRKKAVATVSKTGAVTGAGAGSCTVVARYKGKALKCRVSVED